MNHKIRNILLGALLSIGLGVPYLQAADVAISALPAGSALGGTEAIPAVQSAATVKITPAQLDTYISGTTKTLTNKTLTSPILTSPQLGTPASGVMTNVTGLPLSTGVTGQLPLANGGTGANLTDPNADRIAFWDDSAGAVTWLTAGTGLTITGTTIDAAGGGGSPAGSSGQMQYNDASAFGAANFWRESADIIAQRNSTTAQTFYVYDTYTDSSNYGRLAFNTSLTGDWLKVAAETAGTGADNYNLALTPSGTGAISAHVPDSTTAGGNARGNNAVDWQTATRNAATQVASGTSSTLSGGQRNTSSSSYTTVAGGFTNAASAQASAVGGGESNTASGQTSVIAGGLGNTASGVRSWIPGGYQALTRGLSGAYAYSAGQRAAQGDAQVIGQPVRRTTTDATPVSLATDGTPAATTVMVLPASSTLMCTAMVVAQSASAADNAGYQVLAVIQRDGSSNTALVGTATTTTVGEDTAGMDATIIANDTLESAEIQVTGVAATTIQWMGELKCVQVL